jgi:protein CLEC16A
MLEALIRLMCRRPPPYAEVLWQAGWLLRQLLPYQEHKISDVHMSLLNVCFGYHNQRLGLLLWEVLRKLLISL